MQVVPPDDDRALHLGRHDDTREDTTTDRDVTGEGAFLVNVVTLDGLLGGLEAEADLLVPALFTVVTGRTALDDGLGVLEDVGLLLVGTLDLSQARRRENSGCRWAKGQRFERVVVVEETRGRKKAVRHRPVRIPSPMPSRSPATRNSGIARPRSSVRRAAFRPRLWPTPPSAVPPPFSPRNSRVHFPQSQDIHLLHLGVWCGKLADEACRGERVPEEAGAGLG